VFAPLAVITGSVSAEVAVAESFVQLFKKHKNSALKIKFFMVYIFLSY
jgi:hypothetical protein